MEIAIIGGTGKEGRGLAVRFAAAGHAVSIGSRDAERACAAAGEMTKQRPGLSVQGFDNREAAERGTVALLCVPYAAQSETLGVVRDALQGKTLVHLVIPLRPPHVTEVHLPPGGAAALEARAILHPSTSIVAALHHVGAAALDAAGTDVDCDVLVCSDDTGASERTIALLADIGLRGIEAGPLRNSIALEAMTPVLLHINRAYGAKASGIRITGLRSNR